MRSPSFPIRRRLELRAWPVTELHEFELIYWFRRWFASEDYSGCAQIRDELSRREKAGELTIPLLVDGFRDKYSGQPVFTGMGSLLDGWRERYPPLFTWRAAESWLDAQETTVAS